MKYHNPQQRDWIASYSIRDEQRTKLKRLRDDIASNLHKHKVLTRAQLDESWDDIKRATTRL
jgi:hypothetical protein